VLAVRPEAAVGGKIEDEDAVRFGVGSDVGSALADYN